ncbi:MAG: 3-oxoacyl-[acyl-carrier-protein] reductase [Candidatus Marinimicrobia bacterium]|nr:3-oxoacyl-[acyl-carrier-protein] reductase [Candidatus Neomarinimicrobiota bacterium]|tara:strand:+ start:14352 stop:15095 length:744 start_codon:yes stop_codon:yes gene_type:complete
MYNLKNKTAIVTGASKGIGKNIAINLSKHNVNLCLLSRSIDKLNIVKKEIQKISDVEVSCFEIDVKDIKKVELCIKKIIETNNKIDILVNNAGITKDNLILRMKKEDWDEVININLTGYFNMCKSVTKYMIKQKYGRIINISSIIGLKGNLGQANYSASKAGIIGLSNSLSKELGSRNITVNTIAPGFIKTNMTDNLDEKSKKDFLNKISLKKFGKTEDVANLVCFLASDLSSYITGQTINIDGGMN